MSLGVQVLPRLSRVLRKEPKETYLYNGEFHESAYSYFNAARKVRTFLLCRELLYDFPTENSKMPVNIHLSNFTSCQNIANKALQTVHVIIFILKMLLNFDVLMDIVYELLSWSKKCLSRTFEWYLIFQNI